MKAATALAASMFIQLCFGSLYAWSIFVPSLRDTYGFTSTQTQLIFGTTISVSAICFAVGGLLFERFGPKLSVIAGASAYLCGYLLASFSGGNFYIIWLGVGALAGAGVGLGYLSPLITSMMWFPKRKGIVTGLTVASFGAGSVLLSAIAGWALNSIGVLEFWRIAGLVYGIALLLAAAALSTPGKPGKLAEARVSLLCVMKERVFWGMVAGFFCGTFAGLLVVGNLKPIALAAGVSPAVSTAAIGAFALGNAAGRITWGWLFDKKGKWIIPISLVFLGGAVMALMLAGAGGAAFLATAFLVGAGFGASFVVYAAQVAAAFGAERVSSVYSYVILTYAFSGTLGPLAGGILHDITSGYQAPIIAAISVALAGAVATSLLIGTAMPNGRNNARVAA